MDNTKLEYVDNSPLEWHPMWWHEKGLSETASGYGSKLNTGYKTWVGGRLYRVYCICYSNVGTLYIIQNGKRKYLKCEERAK